MASATARLALALALAGLGGAFKLYGALLGSRALLVDGLSSVANLLAGALALASTMEALRPPDEDHPYGHRRLEYRGVIYMVALYSGVSGYSLASILHSTGGYSVEPEAWLPAAAGTLLYAASVLVARGAGLAGSVYARLTGSEVLEGLVGVGSSLAGSRLGYAYDLAGASLLLAYLVLETGLEARRIAYLASDYAPPRVVEEARRLLEERGLRVERLRVRTIVPGEYHGDAVVYADGIPLEVVDILVDEAVYEARRRLNLDLVVHLEASRSGSRQRPHP